MFDVDDLQTALKELGQATYNHEQWHKDLMEIEYSPYNRDTLTGAENRIGMVTKLREQLELVKRHVLQCCIVLMDPDHFKDVNDRVGHLAGDQVLAGAVRHIKDHLRPYDRVFCYGGEEFLIVLPNTDLAAGRDVIERIRVGLAAIALTHAAGEPVFVTASFGLTPLDPDAYQPRYRCSIREATSLWSSSRPSRAEVRPVSTSRRNHSSCSTDPPSNSNAT